MNTIETLTQLYADACQDREELIEAVEAVLTELGAQEIGHRARIRDKIERTLARIEDRKAVARLHAAARRTP